MSSSSSSSLFKSPTPILEALECDLAKTTITRKTTCCRGRRGGEDTAAINNKHDDDDDDDDQNQKKCFISIKECIERATTSCTSSCTMPCKEVKDLLLQQRQYNEKKKHNQKNKNNKKTKKKQQQQQHDSDDDCNGSNTTAAMDVDNIYDDYDDDDLESIIQIDKDQLYLSQCSILGTYLGRLKEAVRSSSVSSSSCSTKNTTSTTSTATTTTSTTSDVRSYHSSIWYMSRIATVIKFSQLMIEYSNNNSDIFKRYDDDDDNDNDNDDQSSSSMTSKSSSSSINSHNDDENSTKKNNNNRTKRNKMKQQQEKQRNANNERDEINQMIIQLLRALIGVTCTCAEYAATTTRRGERQQQQQQDGFGFLLSEGVTVVDPKIDNNNSNDVDNDVLVEKFYTSEIIQLLSSTISSSTTTTTSQGEGIIFHPLHIVYFIFGMLLQLDSYIPTNPWLLSPLWKGLCDIVTVSQINSDNANKDNNNNTIILTNNKKTNTTTPLPLPQELRIYAIRALLHHIKGGTEQTLLTCNNFILSIHLRTIDHSHNDATAIGTFNDININHNDHIICTKILTFLLSRLNTFFFFTTQKQQHKQNRNTSIDDGNNHAMKDDCDDNNDDNDNDRILLSVMIESCEVLSMLRGLSILIEEISAIVSSSVITTTNKDLTMDDDNATATAISLFLKPYYQIATKIDKCFFPNPWQQKQIPKQKQSSWRRMMYDMLLKAKSIPTSLFTLLLNKYNNTNLYNTENTTIDNSNDNNNAKNNDNKNNNTPLAASCCVLLLQPVAAIGQSILLIKVLEEFVDVHVQGCVSAKTSASKKQQQQQQRLPLYDSADVEYILQICEALLFELLPLSMTSTTTTTAYIISNNSISSTTKNTKNTTTTTTSSSSSSPLDVMLARSIRAILEAIRIIYTTIMVDDSNSNKNSTETTSIAIRRNRFHNLLVYWLTSITRKNNNNEETKQTQQESSSHRRRRSKKHVVNNEDEDDASMLMLLSELSMTRELVITIVHLHILGLYRTSCSSCYCCHTDDDVDDVIDIPLLVLLVKLLFDSRTVSDLRRNIGTVLIRILACIGVAGADNDVDDDETLVHALEQLIINEYDKQQFENKIIMTTDMNAPHNQQRKRKRSTTKDDDEHQDCIHDVDDNDFYCCYSITDIRIISSVISNMKNPPQTTTNTTNTDDNSIHSSQFLLYNVFQLLSSSSRASITTTTTTLTVREVENIGKQIQQFLKMWTSTKDHGTTISNSSSSLSSKQKVMFFLGKAILQRVYRIYYYCNSTTINQICNKTHLQRQILDLLRAVFLCNEKNHGTTMLRFDAIRVLGVIGRSMMQETTPATKQQHQQQQRLLQDVASCFYSILSDGRNENDNANNDQCYYWPSKSYTITSLVQYASTIPSRHKETLPKCIPSGGPMQRLLKHRFQGTIATPAISTLEQQEQWSRILQLHSKHLHLLFMQNATNTRTPNIKKRKIFPPLSFEGESDDSSTSMMTIPSGSLVVEMPTQEGRNAIVIFPPGEQSIRDIQFMLQQNDDNDSDNDNNENMEYDKPSIQVVVKHIIQKDVTSTTTSKLCLKTFTQGTVV